MKFYYVFLGLLLLVGMSSCNEDLKPNEVLLYGDIKGQGNEPLMLYYKSYENGMEILDTTIQFKNDKFKMKFVPKGGFGFYFIGKLNANEAKLPLFLENSAIKIEGVNNFFSDSKVSGSESNELFKEFSKTAFKEFQLQRQVLITRYNEANSLKDSVLVNKMTAALDDLTIKEHNNQTTYIKNNPNNYFSLHMYIESYIFYTSTFEEKIEIFNQFSDEVKNSKNGQWIQELLNSEEKLQTGKKVGNFKIPSLSKNSESAELHKLLKEQKLTLIDFWASWCAPCRVANVDLVKVYKKYNREEFEILAFSLDEDLEAWKEACRLDQVTWINVCDKKSWKSDIAKLFNIRVLPKNLLINSEGFILDQDIKSAKLDSVVNHFLIVK